jgi:hypothetical protein
MTQRYAPDLEGGEGGIGPWTGRDYYLPEELKLREQQSPTYIAKFMKMVYNDL